MSYQHVLNLDTIGGVEELFIHFLSNAKNLSPIQQHVLVTSNKPHKFFTTHLQSAASLATEKFLGPLKVPGSMRKWNRARLLAKNHPDTCILWNRMEQYPWPGRVVYYEHGASWIAKKTKESCDFFENVDTILVNSRAAKRVLELKWGIQKPITVIENPLKPTIVRAPHPKKAPRTLKIGYIGRLIPLKGVALLLHALAAVKEQSVTLSVAGDGPEKEHLIQLAKRLGVAATFYGTIKDVSAFYDSIDLLVVPSIREPLGLVAQEAALRGCPVIAAKVDGLPEVVKDGVTGFCLEPTLDISNYTTFGGKMQNLPDLVYNPTSDTLTPPKLVSPEAIAHQISYLMQNPATFESLSKNAIDFASKRPSFAEYSKTLLSALR